MSIKEINNKEVWENFLSACAEKTFVNSWDWGEFQKKEGERVWRFGVFDGENQIASASVVKIEAKRGTFLFVPHGPNVKEQDYNPPFSLHKVTLHPSDQSWHYIANPVLILLF